jgi:hypothetical protein
MNYKDNRLCGILFNRFYRLEIHSLMVCIFDPACDLLPPWKKELCFTCVLLALYCIFSLTSFTSPLPNVQYKQTVCDWGGGGGGVEMFCGPYSAGVFNSVSDQIQNKIASPPLTKMTSKDDIKGLVSLKFLRPWFTVSGKQLLTSKIK